ncbi:unnamed protein product [Callosobruchus maculatus]|uniref:TIL domain-containing protein n=1 Tax=Callosobruchus maculatus TaxID=64391 RepID=A0A653CX57_CALMS|nr:unnamed protein product [Callosobruchus maculatus]
MVSKAFLFGMLVVLFAIVAVSEVQAGACETDVKETYKNTFGCVVNCKTFCERKGCVPNPERMCYGNRCLCASKNEVKAGVCETEVKETYKNTFGCVVNCKTFCNKHGCEPNPERMCYGTRCLCASKNM